MHTTTEEVFIKLEYSVVRTQYNIGDE